MEKKTSRLRRAKTTRSRIRILAVPRLTVHRTGQHPADEEGKQHHQRRRRVAESPGNPALRDLEQVPRKELLAFDGGDSPQSGPCEARAAHGYFGIDAQVVDAIVAWIKATPPR